MKRWIDRLFFVSLVAIIGVLVFTAIPSLTEGHLGGNMLLGHMMASGALVFMLPVFAIAHLFRNVDASRSTLLQRCGYWALVLSGLVTIATIFACMLPILSTDQMRPLIQLHGYAGYAMVPALIVLIVGASHWRRIRATRSATAG